MASIQKLSIRGIRSFSDEEEQVIEFLSPLTMIVGSNGCGKTTIIECLKYACTGALPPNAGKGQYFVHDPKVSGTNEVKANIELRFSGRDGKVSVVIRSFQLTQKRVALQFKALDGVIRTKDENGNSVSITHKCTELESHIPFRLGVSKAILEHVVLCHQEDASWPLQDSKSVKMKFDDIFESARYTKALDEIKSTKKEYDKEAKNLQVDLAGLQERLHAARDLQSELEEARANYDGIRQEMEDIDARNNEHKESLEKLRAIEEQVDRLEAKKHTLELACRDLDVRIAEKRDNIGDALSNDSDEVLEKNLREFDINFNNLADEIRACKKAAEDCTEKAAAAKRTKGTLQGDVGRLKEKISQQKRAVVHRDRVMEKLSARYGIFNPAPSASAGVSEASGSVARYTSEDISSFKEALQGAVDKANKALAEARTKANEEDEAMSAEVNKLRLEEERSAEAIRNTELQQRKVDHEESELTRSGGGRHSQMGSTIPGLERELKRAENDAANAQKQLDEFTEKDEKQTITRATTALDKRVGELKVDLDDQEDKVRRLGSQQRDQLQKTTLLGQIEDLEVQLQEQCKESSNFIKCLAAPLQAITTTSLERAFGELREKRAEVAEDQTAKGTELRDLRRSATEKETVLDQTKRELVRVKRDIDALSSGPVQEVRNTIADINSDIRAYNAKDENKRKIDLLADFTDFDQALEFRRNQAESAREEAALSKHWIKFAKKQLKLADHSQGHCPACRRHMNEQELEVFKAVQDEYINDETRQTKIQEALERAATAIDSVKHLEDHAQGWREWKRLSSMPVELDAQVSKIEQEVAKLNSEVATADQEFRALGDKREQLDAAHMEASKLLDKANAIDVARLDVQQIESKISRYGSEGSLSEAQDRVKDLRDERDRALNELQAKNRQLHKLGEEQLQLERRVNALEGYRSDAAAKLKERKEFDIKKESLRQRRHNLEVHLKELKSKEQPLRQELQEKSNDLKRLREKATAARDRLQAAAQKCQSDAQKFSQSQEDMESWLALKLPEELDRVSRRLEELEATIGAMERQADESKTRMNGKILISDKQRHTKKLLKDNMEYRGHQREKKKRQEEVAGVEAEIAKTDSQDVRRKISELSREMSKRTETRATLRGRLDGIGDQIQGYETKLRTDTYNHIEEKHRRKMIEHRTTEMAVSDLDKYWAALDKALLRFHTMKIADINKIIRELWAETYSGEDIDMIEIVSGDEGEDINRAKRSYNYRVVMRKNDATLDMKGRCSAGQRVLASVVIRLALAESFCVTCGFLALDEPTTNLDHNNKAGLAHALAKIISSRSKQSNFQLITITHDEDFVQTMRRELETQGGISMPESYYRISREEMKRGRGKFYSRINRKVWDDM